MSERDLEFASRPWIEAAGEILARLLAGQPHPTASFSASEVFTAAPHALGWPDDRAAWHLRVEGRSCEVGEGELPGAQLRLVAPYHSVLSVARTVYGGDAVVAARAKRENLHRVGTAGTSVEGTRAADPQLGATLGRLHDELARRTMDSPDVTDRLLAYGLMDASVCLQREGFVVVERAVSDDLVRELSSAPDPGVDREVLEHPWTASLAEAFLGRAAQVQLGSGRVIAHFMLRSTTVADHIAPAGSVVLLTADTARVTSWTNESVRVGFL